MLFRAWTPAGSRNPSEAVLRVKVHRDMQEPINTGGGGDEGWSSTSGPLGRSSGDGRGVRGRGAAGEFDGLRVIERQIVIG